MLKLDFPDLDFYWIGGNVDRVENEQNHTDRVSSVSAKQKRMQRFPSLFCTQAQCSSELEGDSNMNFAINLSVCIFQHHPEATPDSEICPFPNCWNPWIAFPVDPFAIHFLVFYD